MKKTLIIFFLLFSSSVFAEWQYVTNVDRGDSFYIDFKTIKKVNNKLYYFELTNYPDHLGLNYKSDTYYYEVDCETWLFKRYSGTYFSEEMGKGKIVSRSKENEIIFAPPNTIRRFMLKLVCDFK